VKLASKKSAPEAHPPTGVNIVPAKKKISAAPSAHATLRKPKFLVPSLNSPKTSTPATGLPPATPAATGRETRKRRFTERRISIEVKPAATRKYRKTVGKQIESMPIAAVRRMLLRKGILKPKATFPPEEMMRSMLKDYMLLHAAE
jgi:hypothetical protein